MPAVYSPITLEIIVLVLGLFLLFAESFAKGPDKSWMARLSIAVLGMVFLFSFFTSGIWASI
jgi:hypothetical protein